jgi:hypothetical protein
MPGSATDTHRAFLDGLMPFFYTDWYRNRLSSGQGFSTGRYENIFGYFPGHMAKLVSTSASSCALVAPLPA